ncbi:hypothetical protein [Mastigocladopsis repens]|uniref:hypothetical protein n=1 Tax=Mastigocladopsis repens TaxID=221287 RepID=UPI000307DC1D|nr:hypothetical protein [Mastigocladopsis repens]
MSNSFVKRIAVFGLLCSLLTITAACGESSSDTNSTQINQTTEVRNGQVKLNCSSNSPNAQATTTVTVNGQQYKCENGRTIQVR